jgi:hypothetical protein
VTADGTDPALRRFERDAVGACVAMTIAAFAVVAPMRGPGTASRAALGVVGGGLLTAFSYRAIKGAADLLVEIASQPRPEPRFTVDPASAGLQPLPSADPGGAEPHASLPADPGRAEATASASADPGEAGVQASAPPVLSFGRRALLAVKFFTRYALLAVAAYVMLTRFRLHPVGVLAGATSPFLAALMQVFRMPRVRRPRAHP